MSQVNNREIPELTINGQLYLKCECGDLYPDQSYGAGFMVANDGVCENCDAEQPAIPVPVARNLLGELYQVLGALDAGAKVLDQVSAAINGQPLPHQTLLPYVGRPIELQATVIPHGDYPYPVSAEIDRVLPVGTKLYALTSQGEQQ